MQQQHAAIIIHIAKSALIVPAYSTSIPPPTQAGTLAGQP